MPSPIPQPPGVFGLTTAAAAATTPSGLYLLKLNNLSDLSSASAARTNLGLGSAATQNSNAFDPAGAASSALEQALAAITASQAASGALLKINNLSDVANISASRINLGLGTASTEPISFFLQTANNLSEVPSVLISQRNLGLGIGLVANTISSQFDLNSLTNMNPAKWQEGAIVTALGFFYRDDGGGGLFEWNSTDVTAADGFMIIRLAAAATGRLRRVLASTRSGYPNTVNILWFGAAGTNTNDIRFDTAAAVNQAILFFASNGANQGAIYFPAGTYAWISALTIAWTGKLTLFGDGPNSTIINVTNGVPVGTPPVTGILSTSTLAGLCIRDLGFITDLSAYIGNPGISVSGQIPFVMRGIDTPSSGMQFDPFIKCTACALDWSGVKFNNNSSLTGAHTSGAIGVLSAISGTIDNCFFDCGDGTTGIAPSPCITVQGNAGSGVSDLRITNTGIRGYGAPAAYNTATGLSVITGLWISNNQGTCGESLLANLYFDIRGASGSPANSSAILFDGISSASANVQGWTLTGVYANGPQETLRIHGGNFHASNYDISNIHCVPNPVGGATTVSGVHIISGQDIQLTGVSAAGNGAASIGGGVVYGVLIEGSTGGGSGWTSSNIIISGLRGSIGNNVNTACVAVSGPHVINVFASFLNMGVTNPYVLLAGANKTSQSLTFIWPDLAAGLNCSGAVNQNV